MAAKLKLKKKFKLSVFIIIILTFFCIFGINKYNTYIYESSYEYKFLNLGYTIEEFKILENKFDNKKLDKLLLSDKDELIFDIIDAKYYIDKHYEEYYTFAVENEEMSITDVISTINTNTDEFFYEDTNESNYNDNELILVNKYNYLNEDYEPSNLVTISNKYSWGTNGSQKCIDFVYDAFLKMWDEAQKNDFYLMINSSYRSYESQNEVYTSFYDNKGERYADSIAARAGHSEHQTGLALDIFSKESPSMTSFGESNSYNWLKNNAYKFGFILRYSEDDENLTGYTFESWHYRYVGVDVATYIHENNITFDEYYEYYIAN